MKSCGRVIGSLAKGHSMVISQMLHEDFSILDADTFSILDNSPPSPCLMLLRELLTQFTSYDLPYMSGTCFQIHCPINHSFPSVFTRSLIIRRPIWLPVKAPPINCEFYEAWVLFFFLCVPPEPSTASHSISPQNISWKQPNGKYWMGAMQNRGKEIMNKPLWML